MVAIAIPNPQLQINFAFALEQIRATYLQEALSVSGDGDDFQDFANRIIALTSIAAPA